MYLPLLEALPRPWHALRMQLMRRFLGCALAVLVLRAGAAESTNNAAEGLNRFATAAYAKLAAGHSNNLIFSPYSLHVALTMAAAGARGETERQLATVLGGTAGERARNAQKIGTSLAAAQRSGDVSLLIANRAWIDRSFTVLPDYAAELKEQFGAGFAAADFHNDPTGAGRAIDAWVADRTRNRITGLIGGNLLPMNTAMVLANAIYFYGPWDTRFQRSDTRAEPFWLSEGRSAEVPMMFVQLEGVQYGESDGVQMLSIPYRGGRFRMLVLLPQPGGLSALERKLAEKGSSVFRVDRVAESVNLSLPRFESGNTLTAAPLIAALGAPDVFGPDADLSGISRDKRLSISRVLHAARITVNEEGTEAAAATVMALAAASGPDQSIEFRADHPFIYAIYDRGTRAILFLGRVMDPRS